MSEAVVRRRPEDANFGYIVERHGLLIFCVVLTVGALIFAPSFSTAAMAMGESAAVLLLRAFEATSASSKKLRRPCAQHAAS